MKGMLQMVVVGVWLQVLQGASETGSVPDHLHGCKAYTRLLAWLDEAYEDLYILQADANRHHIEEVNNNSNRVIHRARQWITKFQGRLLRITATCNLTESLQHILEKEINPRYVSVSPSPYGHLRATKTSYFKAEHKKRATSLAHELVRLASRNRRPTHTAGEARRPLEREVQTLLLNALWAAHPSHTYNISSLVKVDVTATGSVDVDVGEVVREVPETFLSVALGPRMIQHQWFNFNTSSPLVLTLTRALAPAILRMGGSAANFLTYKPSVRKLPSSPEELLRPEADVLVPSPPVLDHGHPEGTSLKQYGNETRDRNTHTDNTNAHTNSTKTHTNNNNIHTNNTSTHTNNTNIHTNNTSTHINTHTNNTNTQTNNASTHTNNITKDESEIYTSNTIWTLNQHSRSQSDWIRGGRHPEGGPDSDVRGGRHPEGGPDIDVRGGRHPEESLDKRSCNSGYDSPTFTNFTMTGEAWNQLLGLAEAAGMQLLFDVNQFYREEDGSWDPSNARLLMRDAAARGARIIWQLGNEPNAYAHKFGWSITGQEAARDYLQLRQELDHYFPSHHHAPVAGPDVTRPKPGGQQELDNGFGKDSVAFLQEFLSSLKTNLTALSWHQYYVDGRTAQVDDFLSTTVMDQFKWQINQVVAVRDQFSPGTPIWLTETGSAYGGGAPGLSDAYVGGFLWLDKLGVAAALGGSDGGGGGGGGGVGSGGIQLMARQTLYEGCYALISKDLVPNPDYWLSVLYKRLVGGRVLRLRLRQVPPTTRLYAHCLRNTTTDHTPGAVVVFGMNLQKEATLVRLEGHLATSPLLQYLLLPPDGDLRSRRVMLNGQLLQMTRGGELPALAPTPTPPALLHLPPTSLGFWVLPHAHARACL